MNMAIYKLAKIEDEGLRFLLASRKAKICPKCNLAKTMDAYFKDRSTSTGYEAYCKICAIEKRRKYPWK